MISVPRGERGDLAAESHPRRRSRRTRRSVPFAKAAKCAAICAASSRVGARIKARVFLRGSPARRSRIGSANAAVLPVPVLGTGEDVLARQCRRNRGCLDGGRDGEAELTRTARRDAGLRPSVSKLDCIDSFSKSEGARGRSSAFSKDRAELGCHLR